MGLEEVKSDIIEEAEQKADKIIQEAEEKKEQLLDEAEEKADKIKQDSLDELEDEKKAYRKRAISNARMKAKEEKLEAREEFLSRAFEEFEEELGEMTEDDMQQYVESCLEKPEFSIGKVIGNERFEKFVDQEFEVKDDVEGLVVVSEDGNRRQDFSFGRIVEQYRNRYRKQVAEKLFG